jgi:Flp pilus assembly protein TadG
MTTRRLIAALTGRALPHWFHRRDRGVAAVEFALLAPIFLIAFGGVADLGTALYLQIRLESALAIGTNYALLPANIAMVNSTNGPTLAQNIATLVGEAYNTGTSNNPFTGNPVVVAVVNNGPRYTKAQLGSGASGTASQANSYYCPTGSPPNWVWTVSTQGSTCTGGGTAGKFVSITASYTYNTFFPYGFVQNGGAMTIGAMVQVQ